jgi:hypothetical protein
VMHAPRGAVSGKPLLIATPRQWLASVEVDMHCAVQAFQAGEVGYADAWVDETVYVP